MPSRPISAALWWWLLLPEGRVRASWALTAGAPRHQGRREAPEANTGWWLAQAGERKKDEISARRQIIPSGQRAAGSW